MLAGAFPFRAALSPCLLSDPPCVEPPGCGVQGVDSPEGVLLVRYWGGSIATAFAVATLAAAITSFPNWLCIPSNSLWTRKAPITSRGALLLCVRSRIVNDIRSGKKLRTW